MSKSRSKSLANAVSLTAARQNLFELVESVAVTGQPVTLTEHGRPKAVVVSVSDFETWLETRPDSPLPKLQRSAGLPQRSLRQHIKQRTITSRYERLAASLDQAGFMLYEKPTGDYCSNTKKKAKPKLFLPDRFAN